MLQSVLALGIDENIIQQLSVSIVRILSKKSPDQLSLLNFVLVCWVVKSM